LALQATDWAYAAGFVAGEGCISVSRSFETKRGRYQYGVQVVVANRDRDVLDWMRRTWGGWVVIVLGRQGRARPSFTWRCSTGLSARPFLNGIRPWLRIKGPQCDNALAMIELLQRGRRTLGPYPLPVAWLGEQEKLYWIQRELNHKGNRPVRGEADALTAQDPPPAAAIELMLLLTVIISTIK
jgi:hypothetical protein